MTNARFLAFLAFFWPLKHSLDLGITSKVEESHILHGKNDVTLDFFVSSDRSVSLGSLYPLGSQLLPSLRSCVKTTLGGKGCPRKHFCLRRKKNPRWHRFSMEERDNLARSPLLSLRKSLISDVWSFLQLVICIRPFLYSPLHLLILARKFMVF